MPEKFIEAIDTRTGQKMRVPSQWPSLFPHIKARKHHRPDQPKTVQVTEPRPQIPTLKNEPKES
jgi:hypothetical protein